MTTRAVLMSAGGNVHRLLVQNDGADGTACGVKIGKSLTRPVRPVQALVYHLEPCQAPGCWSMLQWAKWVDGNLR